MTAPSGREFLTGSFSELDALQDDDGAAGAVSAGVVTTAEAEDFMTEPQRRADQGVFAVSTFVMQALGTKST